MIELDTLLAFIGVSFLLCLTPGPDNLFVLSQSALYGRKNGLLITLGLCLGLCIHTTIVALGLAGLLSSSELALVILKWFGVAYLAYLAWGAFRAKPEWDESQTVLLSNPKKLIQRGFLMNMSNPKIIIFFLAFFPHFLNQNASYITLQTLLLGTIFSLMTFLVFGSIAYLASFLQQTLRRSQSIQKNLNKITGLILFGLAINLALWGG